MDGVEREDEGDLNGEEWGGTLSSPKVASGPAERGRELLKVSELSSSLVFEGRNKF